MTSRVGSTVRRLFEDGKIYEGVVAVEYTDGSKVPRVDSYTLGCTHSPGSTVMTTSLPRLTNLNIPPFELSVSFL